MELENIVANTVLMKAKESTRVGKGRSKKWRTMLQFSQPDLYSTIRDDLVINYEEICTKQPIGMKLFQQYCGRHPFLRYCCSFISAIEEYKTLPTNQLSNFAFSLFEKYYLNHPSPEDMTLPKKEEFELLMNNRPPLTTILESDGATPAITVDDIETPEPVPEYYYNPTVNELALQQIIQNDTINNLQSVLTAKERNDVDSKLFDQIETEIKHYFAKEPFDQFVGSLFFQRFLQWKQLERQPINEDKFRIFRVLGKGGFGEVFAAQSKVSGKMYAIKKLEKLRVKKKRAEALSLNERKILEMCDSRFVVNMAYSYETKDSLCMVLTIMNGGELKYHIYEIGNAGLSMERSIFYAAEIAMGLGHMHQKRIVYRDMKPENILLDERGHVRISDLGLAIVIPEGSKVKGKVGTAGYMAPEVLQGLSYSFSVDWWGLGCVIYEMVAGRPPFREKKEKISKEKLDDRVLNKYEPYSNKFTEEARLICTQLLEKDPKARLGVAGRGLVEVFIHHFFNDIHWPQLESGKLLPPYNIDERAIYAKDVMDIDQFSSVRGVVIGEEDREFFEKFAIGAVTLQWQNEIIETGLYDDLNVFGPDDSLVPPPVRNKSFIKFFGDLHATSNTNQTPEVVSSDVSYWKSMCCCFCSSD